MAFSTTPTTATLTPAERTFALLPQKKGWLENCTEADFKKRFPTWRGNKRNFNYEAYKTSFREQRWLALLEGHEVTPTIREVRKHYKVMLSERVERAVETVMNQAGAKQAMPSNVKVVKFCMRCKLIDQGVEFLSDAMPHSCKVSFRDGEHSEPTNLESEVTDAAYGRTLAMATTLANSKHPTNAIDHEYSPLDQIKDRAIHTIKRASPKDKNHLCKSSNVQLKEKRVIELKEGGNHKENVIIYAPSGFGKTSLQHRLIQSGIAVIDLDDRASTSLEECEDLLTVSSIITNRLDIALETNKPMIFFKPSTPSVLKERTSWNITDEDAQYWYDQHHKVIRRPKLVICEVTNTYLTHWFTKIPKKELCSVKEQKDALKVLNGM